MARTCAQALFCTDAAEQRPCGRCPGCLQFAAGHPDVHILAPPKGKKLIAAEDVRSVARDLSNRSFSDGRKIVLIDQCELLNKEGQNALLKPLEEASGDAVFFLCAGSQSVLLPTVVSRCRVVRFAPVEERLLSEYLRKRKPDLSSAEADWIAAYSEGSIGRALSCLEDASVADVARSAQKAYEAARAGKGIAAAASMAIDKAQAQEALRCLEVTGRQMLHKGDPEGAVLLQALMAARQMLSANVTWQYTWETLLLRVAEEAAKR